MDKKFNDTSLENTTDDKNKGKFNNVKNFKTSSGKWDDTPLQINIFENKYDNASNGIATYTMTWREFVMACQEKPKSKGKYTIDEYLELPKDVKPKQKDGKMFNFIVFGNKRNETKKVKKKGGFRHNANVIGSQALILDIDKMPKNALKKIKKALAKENIAYVIYTSYAHTPEKPRIRIVIPYSKQVTPEKHLECYLYFNDLLENIVDPTSKTLSRAFYLPACPPGAQKYYECHVGEGDFLDPDDIELSHIHHIPDEAGKVKKKVEKRLKNNYTNPGIKSTKIPKVSIQELRQLPISQQILELIINGENGTEYESRSEKDFAVIQALDPVLLANDEPLDDAFIVAILMDERYKISERSRQRGEILTREEVARIRTKLNSRLIYGVPSHYPEPKYLSIKEAEKTLRQQIKDFFQHAELNEARGIKASCGLGKTTEVIRHITSEMKIDYYVPSYTLAEDLCSKIIKERPDLTVEIVQGRKKEGLCNKYEDQVSKLERSGIPIYENLCRKKSGNENSSGIIECEFYSKCRYIEQYRSSPHIRILTHSHLKHPSIPEDTRTPSHIVIDESFYNQLVVNDEIKREDFKDSGLRGVFVETVINSLKNSQPLLKELRNKYSSCYSDLSKEIGTYVSQQDKHNLDLFPTMTDREFNQELNDEKIEENSRLDSNQKMFKAFLKELKTSRDESYVIRKEGDNISFNYRSDIIRPDIETEEGTIRPPILLIDADLNQEVAQIFFNNIRIEEEIRVKRKLYVMQCYSSTNSNYSLLPRKNEGDKQKKSREKKYKELQRVINRPSEEKNLLVICPKKLHDLEVYTPPQCLDQFYKKLRYNPFT